MVDEAIFNPSVKIFIDCALLGSIQKYSSDEKVAGFTTNPSLMRTSGVTNYEAFCRQALEDADGKPVSLEVFADSQGDIVRQAVAINSWGSNAVVKVPVTLTTGEPTSWVTSELIKLGVRINVTAVFTADQTRRVVEDMGELSRGSYISVFAGRVADAGWNPAIMMRNCAHELRKQNCEAELLWASPRQVFDVIQAEMSCDVITVTPDLYKKMKNTIGKNLEEYSRETVQQFRQDALDCGYTITI